MFDLSVRRRFSRWAPIVVTGISLTLPACGTSYQIVRQATPNPFVGRPVFVFAPVEFAVEITEPGWNEARESVFPSMVERFRARSQFDVHTLDAGRIPDGAFIIRTRIESFTGYRTVLDTQTLTTNVYARFTLRIGRMGEDVLDQVVISMPGYSVSGGLESACHAIGELMGERIEFYLDGRMGLPQGRAHGTRPLP